MPQLREVVDDETGEVYRIETTKQAKRRYQRSAGAHQRPTAGQLNAADIWNRQEEKIKKDREREEKRKKNKLKQEVKDARQKEIQQEKLNAGRISIEDTWGKVNPSQNRLHRFFGAPVRPTATNLALLKERDETAERDESHENAEDEGEGHQDTANSTEKDEDLVLQQELDQIFATSPLTPGSRNKQQQEDQVSSFRTEATLMLNQNPVRSPTSTRMEPKRKQSEDPQALSIMMPPPKRPKTTASAPGDILSIITTTRHSTPVDRSPTSGQQRTPLKEKTQSQVNIRANEKPDPLEVVKGDIHWPTSTQIVRDTLSGLCSQDLEDDFGGHDKENDSPPKATAVDTAVVFAQTGAVWDRFSVPASDHDGVLVPLSNDGCYSMIGEVDEDVFDDDDVDDESLLALAVTQQLKQELFASSRHHLELNISGSDCTIGNAEDKLSEVKRSENNQPEFTSKLGDSFAMDGLNDEDLLEGLDDFENGELDKTNKDEVNHEADQTDFSRRRRVLPWVKNPIAYGFEDWNDIDRLTPSPCSQLIGD